MFKDEKNPTFQEMVRLNNLTGQENLKTGDISEGGVYTCMRCQNFSEYISRGESLPECPYCGDTLFFCS